MNTLKITCLLFAVSLFFSSCSKDPALDPLAYVIIPKHGIIRIECSDCTLNYSVLHTDYTVQVKDSEDITFSYISDFELKTTINSFKDQNIRLVVFDAYGRIISNQLNDLHDGENQTDSFKIRID